MTGGAVVAVDLGATSGRVVVGRVGSDRLEVLDVHRFPNTPVRLPDGLHWNVIELYRNVVDGLRKAVELEPGLLSIGIDSWAVDYGLLRSGRLVGVPYHYRDGRTGAGVEAVHRTIDPVALYDTNGLQFLPFNTVYQLAVDRADGSLSDGTTMLLIPDLIGFWLTGQMRAERTNASTTGLLDVRTGRWNDAMTKELDPVEPGAIIGALSTTVAHEIGSGPIDVTAVGSHDTASAVVAAPMPDRNAAYICSGTWSLIGVETDRPILSADSRQANFTNEGGVDGRTRYLRNVMGMWLVNECVNSWRRAGAAVDLPGLVAAAGRVDRFVLFDVENPSLLPPGDMPPRIAALAPELSGSEAAVMLRSILESLAVAYAATLRELERVSGVRIETVCLVGGASQNALLCQLIADRYGRPLLAGPVEATATGNILVQARTAGLLTGSLEDLRALVALTARPTRYTPREVE
jgi:rhamnulokinase